MSNEWWIESSASSAMLLTGVVLGLLSLSGVPPTLGFSMKWLLISGVSLSGLALMALMPLMAISIYFYTQGLLQLVLRGVSMKSAGSMDWSSGAVMLIHGFGLSILALGAL